MCNLHLMVLLQYHRRAIFGTMTLDFFQELAVEDQIAAVWELGRHIATRYKE